MTDPVAALAGVLDRCLVWLGGPATTGSGVWAAPGLVVTCAHVVPGGPGTKVDVLWEGLSLTATVVEAVPAAGGEGLWPYPDIAVVQVAQPPPHPCAWLGEEPLVSGAPLIVYGHSDLLEGVPRVRRVDGRVGGYHGFGEQRLWQFVGNEIAGGMSGGPVLDAATGVVCGLVKMTRRDGGDEGGFIVPVRGLRELSAAVRRSLWLGHDRYHAANCEWVRPRALLPQPLPAGVPALPWTVADEARLLGLLSGLPSRDDLAELYAASVPDDPVLREPLTDLRELAYELADRGAGRRGQLSALLRMVVRLAAEHSGMPVGQELRDWATEVAARLGEGEPLRGAWSAGPGPATPVHASVVVQIEPGAVDPSRYRLTAWINRGPGDALRSYCDEAATHTLAEVRLVARDQIAAGLAALRGNGFVEVVAPVDLFGEAFDELTTRRYTSVGQRHPVVLRDLDRIRDPSVRYAWRRRWQALHQVPAPPARWLDCVGIPPASHFAAELELAPDVAMLALSRRPDTGAAREALEVALDAGLPVAVWRRSTCPEHDAGTGEEPCSGRRFRLALAQELATCQVSLPELVRRLRNHVVTDPGLECRDVVLVWDDPDRLPEPDDPLVEPGPADPRREVRDR